MSTPDDRPSRQTLDRLPARVLTFLLAVGFTPAIRAALLPRGYDRTEHARGWAMLRAVDPSLDDAAAWEPATALREDAHSAAVRNALERLATFGRENLAVVDATLRHRAPAAHAFLFAGALADIDDAAWSLALRHFEDRLVALAAHAEGRTSPGPLPSLAQITADEAREASALIARRGVTAEARATIVALIDVAHRYGPTTPPAPPAHADPDAALVSLYAWFSEWSAIAHRAIRRRDQLVSLGLATRRAPA
jgi:hypothetical protein